MAEPVWSFMIKKAGSWSPGQAMAPVCVIGRKLLRAMMTDGVLGLTQNQLNFAHGAAPPIPLTMRITFRDRRMQLTPSDWTALSQSEVDDTHSDSGLPKIPDEIMVSVIGDNGTAQDPCPTLTAWAEAFDGSPANATW